MSLSTVISMTAGIIIILLCTYVLDNSIEPKRSGELRYGSFFMALGLILFLVTLTIGLAYFNSEQAHKRPFTIYLAIGMLFMLTVIACYCFIDYFYVYGSYDREGIVFYTPWTGKKSQDWDDLESIEFLPIIFCYLLSFKSGEKLKLSCFLVGHSNLIHWLESRNK